MVHGYSNKPEGSAMQNLDEALVDLRQDMNDRKKQSAFYDLFLNSNFFVPILETPAGEGAAEEDGSRQVLPVVTEAEGKDYLMLFSSLERLRGWVNSEEAPYVEVAGHLLALTTTAPLHWAMNVGTEFSKQFHPDEIAWLREAVEKCNADAAKQQGGCCD
jgi:hypothetical protein